MRKYRYASPELKEKRRAALDAAMKKADALIAGMTLEEKVTQLTQYSPYYWSEEDYNPPAKGDDGAGEVIMWRVGSFLNAQSVEGTNALQDRVLRDNHQHIPALFANDILHGYNTTMPTPIAQSCSWDPEIARRCCEVAAREAYNAGTTWTFAPMVDIARDPRWGRIVEGYGEDPYLASDFSAASVVGFQGECLGEEEGHILACLKHFVAYGACIGGRDYNAADISLQTLHDVYLAPFKAGVEAGAATLMSAFESINGVPASGNKYTLWEVLREKWGFDGFVVSDYDSIIEMINHGFCEDEKDAAAKGFDAGVDVVMLGNLYNTYLPQLVREGVIPEERIDRSAATIIAYKYLYGLMDAPKRVPEDPSVPFCAQHLAVARESAAHSVVLLENDGTLPLTREKAKGKRIAVIGPAADDVRLYLGAWCGPANTDHTVTVLAALREEYGDIAEIGYAQGCVFRKIDDDDPEDDGSGIAEAVALAERSDIVIACVGEHNIDTGECQSKADLNLTGRQEELMRALAAVGKPIITLLANGRPLAIKCLKDTSNALVDIWYGGTEAGHGAVDVICGRHNPSGRLTTSFPYVPGQIPVFYNRLSTGRPTPNLPCVRYWDAPYEPLYPFGYGKSYTEFEYADLTLSASEMSVDGEIEVRVKVTNKGEYAGYDVVQMYVRDLVASRCRPIKELKGYEKVWVEPGETKEVAIPLVAEELAFADEKCDMIVEPGRFKLWIAHDSADESLETEFWVR